MYNVQNMRLKNEYNLPKIVITKKYYCTKYRYIF